MNRNPHIWAVVDKIESAPAGSVLQFKIPRGYKYTQKSFAQAVRRNLTRSARVVRAGQRVIIVKVKE